MYYLGVSASFKGFSIALWDESDKLIFHIHEQKGFFHQIGLEVIKTLFKSHQIDFKDIKKLFCDTGPAASFTGLRMAVAIIKSIAFVYSLPLFEVSSLNLCVNEWAYNQKDSLKEVQVILLDGRQSRFFVQIYKKEKSITLIEDIPFNKIDDYLNKYLMGEKEDNIIYISNRKDLLSLIKRGREDSFYFLTNPDILYINKENLKEVSFKDFLPKYFRQTQAEENLKK
jgi:tRNA threonylcarbamoyl adenosine modification protein YeaZ